MENRKTLISFSFLFILFLLITLSTDAQVIERDTLAPQLVFADESDSSFVVIFNNTNLEFLATNNEIVKAIDKAIDGSDYLFVSYDTNNLQIVSVEELELSKRNKFLEKHDTLVYNDFKFNNFKSFKKNENQYLDELNQMVDSLKEVIPIDALSLIFNLFKDQECNNVNQCDLNNPCLTFDNKRDGCYARAHWMRKIIEEQFKYKSQKIFVYGQLRAINTGNCGKKCIRWGYHVAPYITAIDKNGNRTGLVLDPSLFDIPVTIKEWISAQEQKCGVFKKGRHRNYEITPSYQYFPNGSTDNNYQNTKRTLARYCKECIY